MKKIIEALLFIGTLTFGTFCFIALFAHNWALVALGGAGLFTLLLIDYARDRRSARRRREYWNGTGL